MWYSGSIKDGVFSEEFLKILQNYEDITAEVGELEKEKEITETELNEKEAFLKTGLKNGTLLGAEIIVRRKEVDKLRDKLQYTDTQLSKFNLFDIRDLPCWYYYYRHIPQKKSFIFRRTKRETTT